MKKRIVITGAAGLVGQNLIPRLKAQGFTDIVAIDKNPGNSAILRKFHPDVRVIVADLADPDTSSWAGELAGCDALVSGHAQIGGTKREEYDRNNKTATERMLEAALRHNVPYVVNISSVVVDSAAINNDYSETKRIQEALVAASGIKQVALKPTLMFGWFDRKHMGWLAHFMQQTPIFPIPGDGKFLRQPLYGGDFCDVIASSIRQESTGTYTIAGMEKIDYIDLVKAMKKATGSKTRIQKIPYSLFAGMLGVYGLFTKNPVFTVKQLELLATPDVFEVIDWPAIFSVRATPLQEALHKAYSDPVYSKIFLEF